MKINLPITALAAILSLAFVSAPVHAQTPAPAAAPAKPSKKDKASKLTFSGPLTAVDTTANTITVTAKKEALTISVPATAKITHDKKPGTLADFKVGDKVTGSYTKDATGTLTATTLSSAGSEKKAKAPKATPAAQ